MQAFLNELVKATPTDGNTNFWFPTPENPGNPDKHTSIQKRILQELQQLQQQEKLDPKQFEEQRREFLKDFNWNYSLLTEEEKQQVEDLLVEYNDIFGRHRLDISINTELTIKLTPKETSVLPGSTLSSQSQGDPVLGTV